MRRKAPKVEPRAAREVILAECRWRGYRVVLRRLTWNENDGPKPERWRADMMISVVEVEDDRGRHRQFKPDVLSIDVPSTRYSYRSQLAFLRDVFSAMSAPRPGRKGRAK